MTKLHNAPATPAHPPEKPKATKLETRKIGLTPAEVLTLDRLVQTCAGAGVTVSKSDLLRAAIGQLAALAPASVFRQWMELQPVKNKKPRK